MLGTAHNDIHVFAAKSSFPGDILPKNDWNTNWFPLIFIFEDDYTDFYELIHNLRFCFYISLKLAFGGSNDKPGGLTDLNTADCNSVVGTEGGDIVYANLNPDIHVS